MLSFRKNKKTYRQTEGRTEGWTEGRTDGQTLFYRTLPAEARGPKTPNRDTFHAVLIFLKHV